MRPINDKPALVHIMAWHRKSDDASFEPVVLVVLKTEMAKVFEALPRRIQGRVYSAESINSCW